MNMWKPLAGLIVLGLAASLAPASARSASPAAPGSEERPSRAYLHAFNLPSHGIAIDGYSPVSYFEGRAERGSPRFAVEHDGVTYHLTGARQVAEFEKAPERYVPAFGGWCAYGMVEEDKFPVDPTAFKIVDGRLLLFLRNANVDALDLWNRGDEREQLAKAGVYWKKVQG